MSEAYSDSVIGYLVEADQDHMILRGLDGEQLRVELNSQTSVQWLRNLGEPYADGTGDLFSGKVSEGSLLLAYGPIVPGPSGFQHHAGTVTLVGKFTDDRLGTAWWWKKQISEIANFYRTAQFGDGPIDFRQYRTNLSRSGEKRDSLQETAVLSRMIYGMASSYLVTGNEDHLAVAKAGSHYMIDNMLKEVPHEGTGSTARWWLHGLNLTDTGVQGIVASPFPDDANSIPAYEQIYALAGLTQTFRATGDPEILKAIEATSDLFERYFKDDGPAGGYFSHLDSQTFSPHSGNLGKNNGRKNWNSNGDHAPAYLFNIYLATADQRYLDMLMYTFNIIVTHFPETGFLQRIDLSPFVRERFFADWTPDHTWGWQQNRAVVGHNLKIAWNLMRMSSLWEDPRLQGYATRIAHTMPTYGLDARRGGWYDVLERIPFVVDRFSWHDRKAWWQQEQAILAYMILAGRIDSLWANEAYEAAAFYSANFLDHDYGAVFPTVLAGGIPYSVGDEGDKGSHAMGMYHTAELCYLGATYASLLLWKEPLELWFKPMAGHGLKDNILRVSPDVFPPGYIYISEVLIDGVPYQDFDPNDLKITLPESDSDLTVQVRLAPNSDYQAPSKVTPLKMSP